MGTISFDGVFNEMMKDEEFKKEYEALIHEFELKKQLIKARIKSNMTQSQDFKKDKLEHLS
ncbi:hypothetical protein CPIN17262_1545 [Campylobacter pinnipediorum subsp. pinnipediorum]|uniref:hypothetical protein n=1 Tax=Campylobacter pinnipediorum TaxID=1965231 RepID=UPI00099518EB|nr:hypothetical protein [Campylobacter pinnipediorum]AQW85204.1 hypothetical protein CPIN17262_1545 [Campylobacter pinnipediorum subsp. pinnipediorum]